jgi:hypothetical protein
MDKGKGYLYCHLLLGKAMCSGGTDALFTDDYFEDVSLWKQLEGRQPDPAQSSFRSEKVVRFWTELGNARDQYDSSSDGVVLNVLTKIRIASPAVKQLTLEIQRAHSTTPTQVVEEMITGLILRYRCVGGFESNQHASIALEWRTEFPSLHECFASPLNHVFDSYYSVFDDDMLFNGMGNFFRMVEQNHGCLLDGPSYEMNPPFEETILNKVAGIVSRSFGREPCKSRLILFVPDWPNTEYIPALRTLVSQMSGYSMEQAVNLNYGHVSGRGLTVKTLVFVLVGKSNTPTESMDFLSKCKQMLSPLNVLPVQLAARFSAFEDRIDRMVLKFTYG